MAAVNWVLLHHTVLDNPKCTSEGTNRSKDELRQEYDSNGVVGIQFKARELVLGSHTIHHDLRVVARENDDSINVLCVSKGASSENNIVGSKRNSILVLKQELALNLVDGVVRCLTVNCTL